MRNLKALGLALVAAFAMSAMAATAAQAESNADFSAAAYPATIDGTAETTQTYNIGALPQQTCGTEEATPGVHVTGTLSEESASLTSTGIEYTHCHIVVIGITFDVTVDMNGCDYNFTAGTYKAALSGGKGGSEGTVHIECPSEKEITITIYKFGVATTAEAHANAGNLRCVYHVPPQTPTGTVTYLNGTGPHGKMAVTVKADELKLTTTITNGGVVSCNAEETTESTYNGAIWSEATKPAGTWIDTTVTGTP